MNPITLHPLMRGFISLRSVVTLVLIGALGIVAVAYGQMALAYYRVKQEAIQLANNEIIAPEAENTAIDRFLFNVRERTDLTLTRSDVVIKHDRNAPDVITVDIHVTIPVVFRLVRRTIYRPFVITVVAKRMKY